MKMTRCILVNCNMSSNKGRRYIVNNMLLSFSSFILWKCIFISLVLLSLPKSATTLHLKGTWDSNAEFFKFLTKFGFQKTDPKDLENTQGFIYGNITISEGLENQKHKGASLVVVDSEYFLEFYGNRTQRPVLACPAMLEKIDTIAFDAICKPKGLEDFLRKIPCPKNKLCADEDNPENVVPSYQFTYKVRDVQRPRFWYLSFIACYRDHCEWLPSNYSNVKIDYDIWLVNGNPSVKEFNPLEHHFSFEFHDVLEIHLAAFVIYLFVFILWLYVFNTQRHLVTKILFVCVSGEIFGVFLKLIHVSVFASNGVGVDWLGKLGTLLDLATQCLFMLLLILLAKGLGIITDVVRLKSIIFSLWAVYTLFNIFLYIWNLLEIDNIISNTYEWQTIPGYTTLGLRVVVMFVFLYELRETFGGYRNLDDNPFIIHFGAFYLVWFCYLPVLAIITTQVSPLWRYKTIISINYAVDVLAYLVLIHLLWPSSSILYLVNGDRPLVTYDLEITGLLDDMQETTLFCRQELEQNTQNGNSLDEETSEPTITHDDDSISDDVKKPVLSELDLNRKHDDEENTLKLNTSSL